MLFLESHVLEDKELNRDFMLISLELWARPLYDQKQEHFEESVLKRGKSTGNIKRDYESQFVSEFLNLTYLSPSCNCSLFVYTNVHNKSLDMMSPYLLLHNVMRGCFLLFPKLVKNSYKI